MTSLKSDFFFIDSLKKIQKEEWNTCVDNDHPFIQYEFLFALEKSESACSQTGWKPHHYIECNDKKEIIAICPLYLRVILMESIFLITHGQMLIIDMD
tara:strand:+ start:111 stop:404 length:294 start_codon:yes stop_codon:yes gene_type:complete